MHRRSRYLAVQSAAANRVPNEHVIVVGWVNNDLVDSCARESVAAAAIRSRFKRSLHGRRSCPR